MKTQKSKVLKFFFKNDIQKYDNSSICIQQYLNPARTFLCFNLENSWLKSNNTPANI